MKIKTAPALVISIIVAIGIFFGVKTFVKFPSSEVKKDSTVVESVPVVVPKTESQVSTAPISIPKTELPVNQIQPKIIKKESAEKKPKAKKPKVQPVETDEKNDVIPNF